MSNNSNSFLHRTAVLLGVASVNLLQQTNVLVAGVGGVGGHCAEAIVRAGIGRITICDSDFVEASNRNRQIVALTSTEGESKVAALAARLQDINPACCIVQLHLRIEPENVCSILTSERFDFVVDCIDSVKSKVTLLYEAVKLGLRIVSSGGAGSRVDPTLIGVKDLFLTMNDGLAKSCRDALKRRGVKPGDVTVVSSTELAQLPQQQSNGGRPVYGTVSYMPSAFGLLLASVVIREASLNAKERLNEDSLRRRRVQKLLQNDKFRCPPK